MIARHEAYHRDWPHWRLVSLIDGVVREMRETVAPIPATPAKSFGERSAQRRALSLRGAMLAGGTASSLMINNQMAAVRTERRREITVTIIYLSAESCDDGGNDGS